MAQSQVLTGQGHTSAYAGSGYHKTSPAPRAGGWRGRNTDWDAELTGHELREVAARAPTAVSLAGCLVLYVLPGGQARLRDSRVGSELTQSPGDEASDFKMAPG